MSGGRHFRMSGRRRVARALAFSMAALLSMAVLSMAVLSMAVTRPAAAQEPKTIDDLLRSVEDFRTEAAAENRAREAEFLARKAEQERLLAEAKAALAQEEARSAELEAAFDANEAELEELRALLEERLGSFGELFGVVRQVAGDTRAQIDQSLISAELAGREPFLAEIASARALPTTGELEGLWYALHEEMTEQGRISQFEAPVIARDGRETSQRVTRIGPFTAVSDGAFLRYLPETNRLAELPRQPPARFRAVAGNVEEISGGTDGGVVAAAIDPSRGAILSLLVQAPSLTERLEQGGAVGYIILAIMAAGLLLAGERLVRLGATDRSVRRQMVRDKAAAANPLGRVLLVYESNKQIDVETLELKLDDAILRELPKLERGLSTLKVMAAVAPLLGLLGTVTGMIETFQAITLFGTGDPKLMAGGISQALVTTVLGLIAAIPLLLLHSLAASRAQRITQVLEEQTAGLVAQRAEAGA